jgi:hypothetical protein
MKCKHKTRDGPSKKTVLARIPNWEKPVFVTKVAGEDETWAGRPSWETSEITGWTSVNTIGDHVFSAVKIKPVCKRDGSGKLSPKQSAISLFRSSDRRFND